MHGPSETHYIGTQFNDRNIEVSEVNLKTLTDSFQGRSLPTAERFFLKTGYQRSYTMWTDKSKLFRDLM